MFGYFVQTDADKSRDVRNALNSSRQKADEENRNRCSHTVAILRGSGWAIAPPDFCLAARLAPSVFFGKDFASERVEAAYIARKMFVIYNSRIRLICHRLIRQFA